MKLRRITPEFVDEIPQEPEPGKLYVCCRYRAVMHLCACGCGAQINTPLHPTGWTLTCDGATVSLWPSIGNWSEECQSHYWIRNSNIHWAPRWSKHKILTARKARDLELDQYFSADPHSETGQSVPKRVPNPAFTRGWLTRFLHWILRHK